MTKLEELTNSLETAFAAADAAFDTYLAAQGDWEDVSLQNTKVGPEVQEAWLALKNAENVWRDLYLDWQGARGAYEDELKKVNEITND
jgi:hypothetical protein